MSGSNFNHGVKSYGVPILPNAGGNIVVGNVYFVNSGNVDGSDNPESGDKLTPFATLDYAVGKCKANNGDIILVEPGHAETLVADSGVDIDVAGVTVLGLGNGEDRPIFTFTTAVAADFKLAAANVKIQNLVFKCNIASQVMMIEVSGDDCEIGYCEFREGTATGLNFVTLGVTDDNECDRTYIHDCKFHMPTAGNGASAVNFAKDEVGVVIERCNIYGDFDNAGIDIPTVGNAQVDCVIKDCVITNLLTGQHAIQVNGTGSTGKLVRIYTQTDAYATSIDAGGLEMYECYHHLGTDQGAAVLISSGQVVGTVTGNADVDISEADYTGYINVLTVTAPANGLQTLRIDIDFNKASTGWDNIATAADTLDCVLVAQIDGTNYRSTQLASAQITANGNGTLDASESGVSFIVGPLAAAESLQVHVAMSAERNDCELPYRVTYVGDAPTVTAVAAV